MTDHQTIFNLIDQPCIPVTMTDGSARELSIRDIFRNASRIQSLNADEALQNTAILRMLIAITYGAYPEDMDETQWSGYRKELNLPQGSPRIDAYLSKWHSRFNLFDETQPFMQVAGLKIAGNGSPSLSKLTLSLAVNDRSFTSYRIPGALSPAAAARNIIETHAYGTSGVKHHVEGQADHASLSRGATGWCGNFTCIIIEGKTLADTLAFNHASHRGITNSDAEWDTDKPIWELPPETEQENPLFTPMKNGIYDKSGRDQGLTKLMHGPASLMTRQRYRIRLIRNNAGDVTNAIIANGDIIGPAGAWPMETMGMWETRKNDLPMPKQIPSGQQLWRSSSILLQSSNDSILPPVNILWLDRLQRNGAISGNEPIRISAIGVKYGNNKSVVDSIHQDALDMKLSMISRRNQPVQEKLTDSVRLAQNSMDRLTNLVKNLELCHRVKPAKNSGTDTSRVTDTYWARLDQPYRKLIAALPADDHDAAMMMIDEWNADMEKIFLEAGKEVVAEQGSSVFSGRIDAQGQLLNAGRALNIYTAAIRKLNRKGTGK